MPTNRIVTKELAGIEDILTGEGVVSQVRAGSFVTIRLVGII